MVWDKCLASSPNNCVCLFTLEPCATFLLSWLPQFLFGRVLKSSIFLVGKVKNEKIIFHGTCDIIYLCIIGLINLYQKLFSYSIIYCHHLTWARWIHTENPICFIHKKKMKKKSFILVFLKNVIILIWQRTGGYLSLCIDSLFLFF